MANLTDWSAKLKAELMAMIGEKLDYLETSRPTAVNMKNAIGALKSKCICKFHY
jgi:methylthioribose-1-phosphate isomerase